MEYTTTSYAINGTQKQRSFSSPHSLVEHLGEDLGFYFRQLQRARARATRSEEIHASPVML